MRIARAGGRLLLQPAGYGEAEAARGAGTPLLLEWDAGRLRCIAFPEIGDSTPVVIPLDGARESLR